MIRTKMFETKLEDLKRKLEWVRGDIRQNRRDHTRFVVEEQRIINRIELLERNTFAKSAAISKYLALPKRKQTAQAAVDAARVWCQSVGLGYYCDKKSNGSGWSLKVMHSVRDKKIAKRVKEVMQALGAVPHESISYYYGTKIKVLRWHFGAAAK